MKSFDELKKEVVLIRYIGSEFGTMYFEPDLPRDKETIIRHLDGKLTIELLPIYVELHNSIRDWINNNPAMREFVYMPDLLEVGKDYFIRPFYVYDIAIQDYFDKEDPIEQPILFEKMISAVSQELINAPGKESIIQRILRKSLLEPSGKTYYNYRMNKFVIVEPKISLDDLEEWKQKERV